MKLVEILARELVDWPSVDGLECGFIAQEEDGEIFSTHNKRPKYDGGACWRRNEHDNRECGYLRPSAFMELADDWKTAIITREMWQAERERLGEEVILGRPTIKPTQTIDPLAWRDRIHAIDAEFESLTKERAELVAKLDLEGLALVAGKVEPEEDMSDPSKWQVGDLCVIIGEDSHHFEIGETVRLQVYEPDFNGDGHRFEHLDKRDYWWVKSKCIQWHSRP